MTFFGKFNTEKPHRETLTEELNKRYLPWASTLKTVFRANSQPDR